MQSIPDLARFQEEHERLWSMLQSYQCALMEGQLGIARGCAESLRYELTVHRRVEDLVLLPLFRELGLESEGARVELFTAEHERLDVLAEGLVTEVGRLEQLAASGPLRQVELLAGIEHAFSLKHLFDHHTKREDLALYPALGAAVGGDELVEVWARMDTTERELREQLGPGPAPSSLGSNV